MVPGVDFGQRLKALRKAAGMTQVQLAKRSGVTQAAISELERGRSRSAHSQTLIQLARILNCSPDWLTTGKGDPMPPVHMTDPEQSELMTIYGALAPALRESLMATARSLLRASTQKASALDPYPSAKRR